MSHLQVTILRIISNDDGKLSWYQLDRVLTQREAVDPGVVSTDLMPSLRELKRAGLITEAPGHNPGQPLYSVTPAGEQCLAAEGGQTAERVIAH